MTLAPTVETVPVEWLRSVLSIPDTLIDHELPAAGSSFASNGAARVQAITDNQDPETTLRRSIVQVDLYAYKTSGAGDIRPDWSKAMQLAEEILTATGPYADAQHTTVSRSGYWDARVIGAHRIAGPVRMLDEQRMARVRVDLRIDWTRGTTST